MTDARGGGGDGRPGASIEAVDRKLNVFALANGMDLDRRGDVRVLGWFRDGLERSIRVEPGEGAGTWAIRAAAVRDGRTRVGEIVRTLEAALGPDEILARFRELLPGAVEAANAITSEEGERRT